MIAALTGVAMVSFVAPSAGRAQEESDAPFTSWADAIAEAAVPRWDGERVSWPEYDPRPEAVLLAESESFPLAVQGAPGHARLAQRVLAALEFAYIELDALGWGGDVDDSGYGSTGGFDLYLGAPAENDSDFREDAYFPNPTSGRAGTSSGGSQGLSTEASGPEGPPRAVGVGYDFPLLWRSLDTESTYAWLDPQRVAFDTSLAGRDSLSACVVRAYAEARLARADPAESLAWRRAIGVYLAQRLTGETCAARELAFAQDHPRYGWINAEPYTGEAGALLLEALARRRSGGLVRELIRGAFQWSWDGGEPHGEPDLWDAIFAITQFVGLDMNRLSEEVAVERRLVEHPLLGALALAPAALASEAKWSELPTSPVSGQLELETYGSVYIMVDTAQAQAGDVLRVWLRAELGAQWSLLAVRLDASGAERGRVRAPMRREPRSYIPVELDGHDARILLVVQNQPLRTPDSDRPDERVRGFNLTLDRAPRTQEE